MEVILLENIGNLGNLGDKVDVKSGYGRNFLIPQGKAALATPENIKQMEARRVELEKVAAEELAARGVALLTEQFDAATRVVMERIADLLDPEYLPAADGAADTEAGTRRFI